MLFREDQLKETIEKRYPGSKFSTRVVTSAVGYPVQTLNLKYLVLMYNKLRLYTFCTQTACLFQTIRSRCIEIHLELITTCP